MARHVVIAGNFDFPAGSAAAARVRNLALGLQAHGAQVEVWPLAPQPRATRRNAGSLPLTTAYHAPLALPAARPGRAAATGRRLIWIASFYGALLPAYRALSRRVQRGQCDLFIGYGRSAAQLWPLARLCRHRGVTTILDVVESLAQFHGLGGPLNPVYWDTALGVRQLPLHFDGLSVIARPLAHYYRRLGHPHILVLPGLECWPSTPPEPAPCQAPFRLIYMGALLERDDPAFLLELMRQLRWRGAPVTLDIIGKYGSTAAGRAFVTQIQRDLMLGQAVRLVGYVSDEELRRRMTAADGFILTRRQAQAERFSFPTRLVEMLTFGRTLFVSDVGDIGDYLRDGLDAVLLPTSDARLAAGRVQEVVADAGRAQAIGVQGWQRGRYCFDREYHAARLLRFVERLEAARRGDRESDRTTDREIG